MSDKLRLYAMLLAMGAGWGASIPLAKIAVSTGHQAFGLIFWQMVIVLVVCGTVMALRGKRPVIGRAYLRLFLMVAIFGTVMPDIFYYTAARELPGGIMSIVTSSVPMFSLPIAILLANEGFVPKRLFGLIFGMVGIVLLIGPETSVPGARATGFVVIALGAPLFYAIEGNLVSKWGTAGLDPLQVVFGASLVGLPICFALAVGTGQWIDPTAGIGRAETALIFSAGIHALVYAAYVWLVGRAGSVFAAQTSYVVTATGVLWSIYLLQESYSGWVWLALAMMMVGMFLVQPRAPRVLVPGRAMEDDGAKQEEAVAK
ncbi:DMT family transporter [Roseovarius sp. C7]|uniref:DMT family transporter n=1 Tax=Roseovarius sp. C7 TaxID=3398643 RepID=UPI0039F71653